MTGRNEMTMTNQRFFVLAAMLLYAVSLTAAPRTFVSAASGVDTNPCSRSLPCRSFAAALALTDADGEVIVLDSGGYGAVNVTPSVALISPSGVHGGITLNAAFDGIAVNAGDNANVVLRNLSLTFLGPSTTAGIRAYSVGALYVEGCSILGFKWGVYFDPTTSGARLYVTDSVIRRGYDFMDYGIHVRGIGLNLKAMIDSTQVYDATQAIFIDDSEATIRDSIAVGSVQSGFHAYDSATVVISRSVARGFSYGFFAEQNSTMVLSRCLANMNNLYGVTAWDSNVYVSASTITGNKYQAVSANAGGAVRTRGNNTSQTNANNGGFTIAYSAK